jgi:hypothetical protein
VDQGDDLVYVEHELTHDEHELVPREHELINYELESVLNTKNIMNMNLYKMNRN